ncbi:MAG: HIT domain-containing protein [Candidatus Pacebacteria bacterium]|nr:HIT domain-containing protein [Candidatus Paceibacterota bacterium]
MLKPDCLFCQIIEGQKPAYKIYQDEQTLAFLDIFPVAKGHTLVVPKNHFQLVEEGSEQYLAAILPAAKKVAQHLKQKLNWQAANLIINNGKAAGQVIPHLHLHIIPRYSDDQLEFTQPSRQASEEELKQLQQKLELESN